ncbi:hypothetical protein SCHPADRAFT_896344 [Schizopora paradoxa]|uniref:Uncharacterized protein n=1 Tax=Schizopora paradoxa TaxID=27342 RepID=A0A0H2RKK3_9AGAM|nr:hypothetical protein SCHPADRAFT_896344 [Schizopora paradoxa]
MTLMTTTSSLPNSSVTARDDRHHRRDRGLVMDCSFGRRTFDVGGCRMQNEGVGLGRLDASYVGRCHLHPFAIVVIGPFSRPRSLSSPSLVSLSHSFHPHSLPLSIPIPSSTKHPQHMTLRLLQDRVGVGIIDRRRVVRVVVPSVIFGGEIDALGWPPFADGDSSWVNREFVDEVQATTTTARQLDRRSVSPQRLRRESSSSRRGRRVVRSTLRSFDDIGLRSTRRRRRSRYGFRFPNDWMIVSGRWGWTRGRWKEAMGKREGWEGR